MNNSKIPLREVLGQVILLALLALSAWRCDTTIFGAAIIWLLGSITIYLIFRLLESVQDGRGPAFERTSGLGGNMGGWTISRSFALMIVTLVFSLLTTLVALNAYNNPDEKNLRCQLIRQEAEKTADETQSEPDTTNQQSPAAPNTPIDTTKEVARPSSATPPTDN